jgi:hypothetical protein
MTFDELKRIYLFVPPAAAEDKAFRVFVKGGGRFVGKRNSMASAIKLAERDYDKRTVKEVSELVSQMHR